LCSLLFVSASLLDFALLFVAMTFFFRCDSGLGFWRGVRVPLQVLYLNLNGVVFYIHFIYT
jgi:hypothetical protein